MASTSAARRHEPRSQRTPEREKLAAAITNLAKAERAVAQCKRGVSNAGQAVEAGLEQLDAAAAAIPKAKERDANAAVAAMKAGRAAPAGTLAKAVAAEQAAAEHLDATRAVRDRLEAELPKLEGAVEFAKTFTLDGAINAVIMAEVDVKALIQAAEQLTNELAQKRYVLGRLAGFHLIADADLKARAAAMAYANLDHDPGVQTAAAKWAALYSALSVDPDAPVTFSFGGGIAAGKVAIRASK
jgi:hypothetical protein